MLPPGKYKREDLFSFCQIDLVVAIIIVVIITAVVVYQLQQ